MLKFFEPQSKVQKDRLVLRETDFRMAKYSRRGIVTNFLIYSLCLFVEQNFIHDHQGLALFLTGGLLVTTLLRGYFLFRIDTIYPRGPSAWRNRYFIATLMGAGWWSLILCTLTLVMNMQGEAALLWLYTVVFFATTAHAFAPYSRFCKFYQLIGLVPAALCTFLIGEVVGVFYGAILLFFSYLLTHHSQLMSENYWDRLEAQHLLARKTESLEEEKRDTRASVQLINQYMELLSNRMRSLLYNQQNASVNSPPSPVTVASQRAIFEKIYANVDDFQKVLSKDVELQPRIFNIRHFLQSIVKRHVEDAERKKIELEIALSPALPARLFGDAKRVSQIVHAMVKSTLDQTREGLVFVEVEFIREYEASGVLHVTIARQSLAEKKSFFVSASEQNMEMDLELVLVKALANALGGDLELNEVFSSDGKNLRLRIPLALAELDARADYHRLEYKGKPILLVHPNARWLDHKRLELDAMGFTVQTANSFKRALHLLLDSLAQEVMLENVMYYSSAGDDQAVQFANELLSHNQLKYIHQFVICSPLGRQFFADRVLQQSPLLHYVDKPSGVFEFEIVLSSVYEPCGVDSRDQFADGKQAECRILWVALGKNFDNAKLYESNSMKIHRVGDMKSLNKVLENEEFDLAVVESIENDDYSAINSIRYFEAHQQKASLLAVIGVGPMSANDVMLEQGVDHFIDIESLVSGDTRALRFWASGRHH